MSEMITEHFSWDEMMCHDCGHCKMDMDFMVGLESLRALGPEPIHVDDGYRCPEHNSAVGGVSKSEHLLGMAADVRIEGLTLQQMYDRAKQVPAFAQGGIGVYDGVPFIHVDNRGTVARWARVKGAYVGIEALVTP